MGKNRIGLHFEGWEDYIAKLDEIGSAPAMQDGVEEALIEAKKIVLPKVKNAIKKLPANSTYSTGKTEKSINEELKVEWDGLFSASIDVGFNFEESGDTSIFLMYGTPRMSPVAGLETAVYGAKTQKEVAKVEKEALNKIINKIMNS